MIQVHVMTYAAKLRQLYGSHADPERAAAMSAYMRNQFDFFGIPSPERRELLKSFIVEHGVPQRLDYDAVVRELWNAKERELQYSAMDLCLRLRRKALPEDIELFVYCIQTRSWWDTVDYIAARLIGDLFQRFPGEQKRYVKSWISHEDMWLNRTAIIYQLGYKTETDTAVLQKAILKHVDSKEFFLQKAIGWALRQYSYTNKEWVENFLTEHTLKPLSVREALKGIQRIESRRNT